MLILVASRRVASRRRRRRLRVLRASRASAMKSRGAAINQINGLLVSAPETLRSKYHGTATATMIGAMTRSRPSGHSADDHYVTARVLKAFST